ncbi:MAG: trehalose-phosphatase [Acetobacter sp.]|nr:trehalose-phosphatase [Acetobacter sp.]
MSTTGSTSPHRLPPLTQTAFLLDFDGTLVDIAPTPDAVIVADELKTTLLNLRQECGDALAIISGRPISQIDHFLPDIPFAIAGEHGATIRHRPDGPIERVSLPPFPLSWFNEAEELTGAWKGAHVERKEGGFVLHYRGAPEAGPVLQKVAQKWIASTPDLFSLQPAKMAWEIRPTGVDKGRAVRKLMETPPFADRIPVFVGDDVTDEDAIREIIRFKGIAFRIPADFPTPAALRRWLQKTANGETP